LIFDKVTEKNKLAPFLWLTVYIGGHMPLSAHNCNVYSASLTGMSPRFLEWENYPVEGLLSSIDCLMVSAIFIQYMSFRALMLSVGCQREQSTCKKLSY